MHTSYSRTSSRRILLPLLPTDYCTLFFFPGECLIPLYSPHLHTQTMYLYVRVYGRTTGLPPDSIDTHPNRPTGATVASTAHHI